MRQFKFIDLNETFLFNNTRFKKVSSRTARAIDYGNKVFYFGMNEYSDRIRKPIPVY
jgi:hypothetical protein